MQPLVDIKKAREQAGLSQQQLAGMLGLDQAQVSRMEKSPGDISVERLLQVSTALGIPLTQLLGNAEPHHGLTVKVDTTQTDQLHNLARRIEESVLGFPSESADLPGAGEARSLARLMRTKPNVVLTGPFDAGKTTLLNLLIGDNALPTTFAPTTRTVTIVRHVDDRPDALTDELYLLGKGFNPQRWDEEEHVLEHRHQGGDLRDLDGHLAHGGANDGAEVALLFVDAEILRTCVLIDTPGDGHDEIDSALAKDVLTDQRTDVLIYMAPVQGFFRQDQIAHLHTLVRTVAPEKQSGRNVFVLMSHAAPSDSLSDEAVARVLDGAADRFTSAMADGLDLWESESDEDIPMDGLEWDIRERMFPFYRGTDDASQPGIRSRGQEFLDDLAHLLNVVIPVEAKGRATSEGKIFVKLSRDDIKAAQAELRQADELCVDAAGSIDQLEDEAVLLKKSIEELRTNLSTLIGKHRRRNLADVSSVLDTHLSKNQVASITRMIERKYSNDALSARSKADQKKGAKKLAQAEMPALMVRVCQNDLERRIGAQAKEFADSLDRQLEILETKFESSAWSGHAEAPFDLKGAFIGGTAGLTAVGALATWASTLGNLGAYIIAAQAAGWLSAIGISLPAGGATLTSLMAAVGGPVGVAIGIVVIATIAGFSLGPSWEKSLAKAIVKALSADQIKGHPGLRVQLTISVSNYWDDTRKAVEAGADALVARTDEEIARRKWLLSPEARAQREQSRAEIQRSSAWLDWLDAALSA